jgi:hypothetical protein
MNIIIPVKGALTPAVPELTLGGKPQHMRNLLSYLLLAPLALVLCGCLVYPHTSQRSREIRSKLLDGRTRQPIEGALIYVKGHTNIFCTSDATGRFWLKPTHNFHLVRYGSCPQDWPRGEWWNEVVIAHTNYVTCFPFKPDPYRNAEVEGNRSWDAILLRPRQ